MVVPFGLCADLGRAKRFCSVDPVDHPIASVLRDLPCLDISCASHRDALTLASPRVQPSAPAWLPGACHSSPRSRLSLFLSMSLSFGWHASIAATETTPKSLGTAAECGGRKISFPRFSWDDAPGVTSRRFASHARCPLDVLPPCLMRCLEKAFQSGRLGGRCVDKRWLLGLLRQ